MPASNPKDKLSTTGEISIWFSLGRDSSVWALYCATILWQWSKHGTWHFWSCTVGSKNFIFSDHFCRHQVRLKHNVHHFVKITRYTNSITLQNPVFWLNSFVFILSCECQVYAVASEDMDSLTFGARRFLRHLTDLGYKKSPVIEFEVSKVTSVKVY